MKKLISVLLAAAVLTACGTATSFAAKYTKGEKVTVKLKADSSVTYFNGIQGSLSYGNKVKYVSGSFKLPSVAGAVFNDGRNPILFNATTIDRYTLASDKVIAQAVFTVASDCDSLGIKGTIEDFYTLNGGKFNTLPMKTTIKVVKAGKKAQSMKVTAAAKSTTAAKLKSSNVKIKNAIKVKKAKGKLSYKKVKGSAKISVSKKGVITIKKGSYKKNTTLGVKVKVTAAGTKTYKKASKTVTVKVKIK